MENLIKRFCNTALLMAMALVLSFVTNTATAGDGVKLEAQLNGPTLASGKAKFESKRGRLKLSVEIEDAAPNATHNVSIGGVFSQDVSTNGLGGFDLNLDTDLGDAVPSLQSGDVVEVRLNGVVILSGTL